MPGVLDRSVCGTPITIIDFETTGLTPGYDRVVEMTAVRCDPDKNPRVVLNTLVNPMRKMAATEIHGITDDDVEKAPAFMEVAGFLMDSIADSVVAAYNVYFDMKFLKYELEQAGVKIHIPHMCMMYMRPLLEIGPRCKLDAACEAHHISLSSSHIAADDAMATAGLLNVYKEVMASRGLRTFEDLTKQRNYKYMRSFAYDPPPRPKFLGNKPKEKLILPRVLDSEIFSDPEVDAIRSYWDTIKVIITDLNATDEEVELASKERKRLKLSKEQIRFIHARAFAVVITQFIDDQHLDDKEVIKLRKLHSALAKLGWAPGQ